MEAQVMKCTCQSKGQDRLHGEHMRVHNADSKGNMKCTVCGDTKRSTDSKRK